MFCDMQFIIWRLLIGFDLMIIEIIVFALFHANHTYYSILVFWWPGGHAVYLNVLRAVMNIYDILLGHGSKGNIWISDFVASPEGHRTLLMNFNADEIILRVGGRSKGKENGLTALMFSIEFSERDGIYFWARGLSFIGTHGFSSDEYE